MSAEKVTMSAEEVTMSEEKMQGLVDRCRYDGARSCG